MRSTIRRFTYLWTRSHQAASSGPSRIKDKMRAWNLKEKIKKIKKKDFGADEDEGERREREREREEEGLSAAE